MNQVLDSFKDDFGSVDGLRAFFAPYLSDEAAAVTSVPETRIEFFEYDWSWNDQGS